MTVEQPKVSAQPLLNAIRIAGLDAVEAARLAGYTTIRDGLITVWQADQVAVLALGRHPVEIYGHYWLDQRTLLEEEMSWRNEEVAA